MIHAARPFIGKEELDSIKEVFKTGWLGMGDKVFMFQNELKKIFKRKHVICVNTGTTAIHVSLDSVGVKNKDEVIVPSLTFVGTVQPVLMCGAKPVFCDINTADLNMSAAHLKTLITEKTKAIIPVHYGGSPCDMDAIMKLAGSKGIRVIEDAAHAFGSKYKGKPVGSFGDITCFSFDPIKNITCGDGGAVLLDDDVTAATMVKKRMLGIDKDTWNRYKNKRSWFYEVDMTGYRYHMNNISAAIGIVQLKKYKKLIKIRQQIAGIYLTKLKNIKEITLLSLNKSTTAPFNFTILADNRDNLMMFLKEKGVDTIINYIPVHLHPLFKKYKTNLPNTESVYKRILSIPMHSMMTFGQAEKVVKYIKMFYSRKK